MTEHARVGERTDLRLVDYLPPELFLDRMVRLKSDKTP
jgi:hypothetical protein